MMYHGCDGIFVGSGGVGAENPEAMGTAIVEAVNNWDNPEELARIASGTGKGMKGQSNESIPEEEKLQGRGV